MSQTLTLTGTLANKSSGSFPMGPVVLAIGAAMAVGVVVSPSPLVLFVSGIVAIVAILLLWQANDPPILLVPVLLQFAAVAVKPIMTAFTGSSLQDLADFDALLEPAALFGFAGIVALVIGLRVGAGKGQPSATSEDWPFRQVLVLALSAVIVGHVLDQVAERSGGLRQILLSFAGVKWAGIYVLAYWTLRQGRGLRWLAALVAFEIMLGMSGFFGEFRLVLFVVFGAAMGALGGLRARGVVTMTIAAVLALVLAVFWSSIKTGYRTFLNQGTGEQVVLQPLDERLAYLAKEATEFDGRSFGTGFERLLARLSYIDFLAATMERVPRVLPHEGGAHLGEAILHVLTPRALFPDKAEVPSDTRVTAYYTNLPVAVFAQDNTSISIGYLGELYVDFGPGGVIAVFLMALAYGRCYRAIRDYLGTPRFVNHGLCMMAALVFTNFETALIKLVGSLVMTLVAVLIIQRIIWPFLPFSRFGSRAPVAVTH